jgi:hypothetical protein
MGGLGNQMFQYAAGRCLSYLHRTELKLDRSFLKIDPKDQYTRRDFALDVYNINATIASDSDIEPFLPLDKGKIRNTLQRKLPIMFFRAVINESGHAFHKEFYSYPKNLYLNGFWQSEKYFEPVKELLVKEFSLKEKLHDANAELGNKINTCNSASLHVRRGDYVTNKETQAYHGVCSIEYYQKAIAYLKIKGEIDHLFVFSDDVDWAKGNLKSDIAITVIDLNNPGYLDMYLMSLCKHNIIANSSFSWWGAWLNQNSDKIVIAPNKWFANGQLTPDIYPSGWVKL